MLEIPEAYEYLEAFVYECPVIFASLLDMSFQIRCERTAEHRELYFCTVLDTITDWLHPDHLYWEHISKLYYVRDRIRLLDLTVSITENLSKFQYFSSLCEPYACRYISHNSGNLKPSSFQMIHPEGAVLADIHLMHAPHSTSSDDSSIPEVCSPVSTAGDLPAHFSMFHSIHRSASRSNFSCSNWSPGRTSGRRRWNSTNSRSSWRESSIPLCARDRFIISAMANFLWSIRDPCTRAQAHDVLRSILILIVIVRNAAAFLEMNNHLGPSLFVAMLDIAGNILYVPEEPRRRAYLATFFCAIVARFDSGYPDDPSAFNMAQFVSILRVE